MKISLWVLAFFCASSLGWAQPFGLTNRVANTTLRMPLAPTPTINYRIPPDNPYIGATSFNGLPVNSNNVRTEFYAVGLRNPWRFTFDPVTGWLWLADVGQGAREEVDIIQKGGNYGWAYREGLIAGPKAAQAPAGFTHVNPIWDYGRTEGNSVTGGRVYRGSQIPALYGAYVFADYGSGRIWQMRYETNGAGGTNFVAPVPIASEGGNTISCFGTDSSNGDILFGNVNPASPTGNRIRRIVSVPGGGYAVSNAFEGMPAFTAPVAIVNAPGDSNRLFIVEQIGRIVVITNLASPTRTVFMDISARVRFGGEQGLLGLAFHPGYLTNRYFYAFYCGNTTGLPNSLSRFEISPTNPNVGLTNSELQLIRQADDAGNHNAGDLHFGPDGYLYVTLGDEGNGDDSLNNSQTITKDFFSAIMRLDVDNRPDSIMPNPHPANTLGPSVFVVPATLADTGIFSDTGALTPNAGIIPYDVNTPYWTDGAIKARWFSVPDLASRIVYRGTQAWTFPIGMVWVQHFDLETTNGVPESRRPIETRVLVRDSTTTPGHYGVSYRWNEPTNAVLVAPEGEQQIFTIYDNGTPRDQTWRYPSRADCISCHATTPGRAIGFTTAQLNRDFDYADYAGVVDNQLRALANAGYFSGSVTSIHALPLMARIDDTSFGVQHRARSYLMANCAHCHYPSTTNGNFNARIYQPLSTEAIIEGTLRNTLGDPANRVIRRGSIANSMIHSRLAGTAGTRMPPSLDSQVIDQQAVDLFRDWILELANYQSFPEWQEANFGSSNAPNAAATADPDGDGAPNRLEYYTSTDPNNPADAWSIGIQRGLDQVSIVYTQKPNYGFEVQWSTNLTNASGWRQLNIPENRPNFSGQTKVTGVPDAIEPVSFKGYRVRVFEP